MDKLYELKEMLCKELEKYGKEDKLTAGSLEVVDKLSHSIKNLDKIIENYEDEGYSNRGGSYRGGSYEGNMGGGSYERGGRSNMGGSYRGESYARGRGSNARRDSMGRYSSEGYSRADNLMDSLYGLMDDAPNDRVRQEMQKFVSKIEEMM